MSVSIPFVAAAPAGFLLGLVFFGGLWWTVRALLGSRHPVLLTLASFWARTGLAVAGFLVVTGSRWENALLCLAGFLAARVLLGRYLPADSVHGGT